MDAVEPNNVPFKLYQFKAGTWVEFSVPEKQEKLRGPIQDVDDDANAIVMDELTGRQVSVEHCIHGILTH